MISNEEKLFNTKNEEIEITHLMKFLSDYPNYGEHMAKAIKELAKKEGGDSRVIASKIQRICLIRYTVSRAMEEAFAESGMCFLVNDKRGYPIYELCISEDVAERISEIILETVQKKQSVR
jgi:hypothetical protein